MMAFSRHLPSSGQLSLFLQLQGGTSSLQVLLLRVEQSSIVFFDNVAHIIHVTITDLDFVLVNNFVKLVMRGGSA